MKEETLVKIIEAQQELIKQLLDMLAEKSSNKPEIQIMPIPYEKPPWKAPEPWKNPDDGTANPYVGDYPWGTISFSFEDLNELSTIL